MRRQLNASGTKPNKYSPILVSKARFGRPTINQADDQSSSHRLTIRSVFSDAAAGNEISQREERRMEDVLVVGGGPVGLIAAIGVARQGLQVRIIEAEQGVLPTPRAMGYVRQVLDNLILHDLFDDAARVGFRSNEMAFRIFKTGEAFVSRSSYPEGLDHPYVLTLAIE